MALDSDGNVQLQGKILIKDFNFKEVTFPQAKAHPPLHAAVHVHLVLLLRVRKGLPC